jgi:protein TonB
MYVELGPQNGGFPINISEEGMAFQGIRPLQKDEEIRIAFKLDGINEPVTATARVVWVTESGKAGALQFVDLPEASRNHIRQWIELQRKAESPQHSAEMKISPGKPKPQPKPRETGPLPVLASISVPNIQPEQTGPKLAPAPPPALAPAPSEPAAEPTGRPSTASAEAQPQGESKPSLPAQMAQVPGNRQPTPPATVPLSPRRVKWIWSVPHGFGLVACAGTLIVGAVLLWPYRATVLERLHRNDLARNASLPAPATSLPDLDKPAAEQPTGDLPMTDPAQWAPIAGTLENAAPPPPVDASRRAPAHSIREVVPAAPPVNSRKAPQVPAAPAKGVHPQVTPPALEPAKGREPVAVMQPVAQSSNDLPASGAASAKPAPAVAETRAPAIPAATGSVEIISDPYPSIRMPASSQAPASRLGASLQIGRLASKVEPAYPAEALRQKIAGTVKLHVVIGANGGVQSAEVIDGPALLADAALRAVEQWRYDPTMLGGIAVEVEEGVTLVFRITNPPASTN